MRAYGIEMRRPDDFHVHLREPGGLLDEVLPATVRNFGRALIMPNLTEPIVTGEQAVAYRQRILKRACKLLSPGADFEPLMTIKLTPETTAETIHEAFDCGVVAAKLYPDNPPDSKAGEVTTGSGGGIYEFTIPGPLMPVFAAMEELGMVLPVHAETPDEFVMDRETHFVEKYVSVWAEAFPKLKIVIEHATTLKSLRVALKYENVACSITAHHLLLTLDDVIGGKLRHHNFCKPVAKTRKDREALIKAATSGDPSFFFGSDSAPHRNTAKESGSAGCFTSLVALPIVAQVFERVNELNRFEPFMSIIGARFYGKPLNEGYVKLVRERWQVPYALGLESGEVKSGGIAPMDVVPFMAGEYLDWSVAA